MKHAAFFLCTVLIMVSGIGCAAIAVGEMETAVPQGKGVWRIGAGIDFPLAHQGNDSLARAKHIVLEDKSQRNRFSGRMHLRYGLDDETDLGLTTWYVTSPGLGLRATVKRSFSLAPKFKTALFASLHHFFTINEVPHWEVVQNIYNRRFSGFTVGGVGSWLVSREGAISEDAISVGIKFSFNRAVTKKRTVYFSDPFSPDPPPPPHDTSTREAFQVATPFLGLSIGNSQSTTWNVEGSLPVAIYDGFRSAGPLYGQVSLGVFFRIASPAEEGKR